MIYALTFVNRLYHITCTQTNTGYLYSMSLVLHIVFTHSSILRQHGVYEISFTFIVSIRKMDETYLARRKALSVAVAALCLETGFGSASEDALANLTEMIQSCRLF